MTDWREAARGIPPIEHTRSLVWTELFPGWAWKPCVPVQIVGPTVDLFLGEQVYAGQECVSCVDVVPNLAHADVRPVYDRRLALALGAPPEAAQEIVWVDTTGGACFVAAGVERHDPGGLIRWRWHVDISVGTADPLLARALAWPADKRVGRADAGGARG